LLIELHHEGIVAS